MKFLEKINKIAGDYFALLVISGAAIGLYSPGSTTWIIPHIPILLGVIMFGMGMTLSADDFRIIAKSPKDALIGVLAQYTIMPFAAFVISSLFNLPAELAVGVILVGTCPGGTASNVITYLAKGDVALSVSMTAVSTLIAPIATPLLTLLLAGKWIPVSAFAMFISIVKIVLAPVILGIVINHFFNKQIQKFSKVLPLLSVAVIVVIVSGVVGVNSDKMLTTALMVFAVVAIHNCTGLLTGYYIGNKLGLAESSRRAVSIEVGMQNSGLAVTLAIMHFDPIAAIPAAIFSVWHNITGPMLATVWGRGR